MDSEGVNMNGYIRLIVLGALIGMGIAFKLARGTKEKGDAWIRTPTIMFLFATLGGMAGGILCIVPLLVSYFTMPLNHETKRLEKMPGHEYYISEGEEDSYGAQRVKFVVSGKSYEETGNVLYDLSGDEVPYMDLITNRPGWFQRLFPPERSDERTFHVRPLNKDLSWFEGQKKAIEDLDVQIEGLRQPNSLRGYAPATLISQAEGFNREQLQKLIVQRDILAMTYNKEASRLDRQGFNDQLPVIDGYSEVDVPYQIKILGEY